MNLVAIILIVGNFTSVIFSSFIALSIFLKKEHFPTLILFILNILMVFLVGIFFSSLYTLSLTILFSPSINIALWKWAIFVFYLFLENGLFIICISQEDLKCLLLNIFISAFFLSMLMGALLAPDSILILSNEPLFTFYHADYIQFLLVLYSSSLIALYLYFTLIHYFLRTKNFPKRMVPLTILFIIPIITYLINVLYVPPFLILTHLFFIWFVNSFTMIIMLRNPELFFNIASNVYSINVYHRSGILLFSHLFNKINKKSKSTKWGQILIGLNHILSEFVEKSDKIDLLKTRDFEIIVKYVESHGIAILIIADRKNLILNKILDKFTQEFVKKFDQELLEITDLNKLINLSEFKGADELVKKHFTIYL
ncbi:MAG: hypothetical protein ACTSU4_03580 [Promethearchaeota archaeon]